MGLNDMSEENKRILYVIITTCIAAFILVAVGATTNHPKLWKFLRTSKAFVIGVATQIFIVPLIAWTMTMIFQVDMVRGLAVMILGTCPGGAISNIVVFFAGGKVELSIAMTATTSLLALGFMPFWLFIFSKFSTIAIGSTEVTIPFVELGITLITFLIPINIGMVLNYKFPGRAKRITKIFAAIGGTLLITVAAFKAVFSSTPLVNLWSWKAAAIAALNPFTTFVVGVLVSQIPRLCGIKLSADESLTIGVEVALQNVKLAGVVLLNSFNSMEQVLFQMMVYIAFTGAFQGLESLFLIVVVRILKLNGCINKHIDSKGTESDEVKAIEPAFHQVKISEPASDLEDNSSLIEMQRC